MSAEFLLDASAWMRSDDDELPDSRANEIAEDWEEGRLAVCLPFLLEAGYAARSARNHTELFEELLGLPFFGFDAKVEHRAIDVHAQLARIGHHRVPPVDVMIAAIAERHEIGVLHYDSHYDSHYDMLVEKTDLDFHSVWLMPAGSLN